MDFRIIYSTPFFGVTLLIGTAAFFVWRRRSARGGWYLIFLCLAASVWSMSEGMLYLGLSFKTNILITKFQYFGIAPIPPLFILFSLSIFDFENWITRIRALLFLLVGAVIILVWTNPLHKLVFSSYFIIEGGQIPMLGLKHGPIWWSIIMYHHALLIMMTIILLYQTFAATAAFHRSQALIIMGGMGFVWIANAVYISGNSPIPNMDISPLAFAIAVGAMALGFFRYNLLDILPMAKSKIFHGLEDPLIVLDEKNRIIEINPAAESIFEIKLSKVTGRNVWDVFDSYIPSGFKGLLDEADRFELPLLIDNKKYIYDFRISPIKSKKGNDLGQIISLRNITDIKQAEKELLKNEKKLARSKKMESLGLMAGGIAHDLNNILSGIVSYPDLLLLDLPRDNPMYKPLKTIQESGMKAADFVADLLTIARGIATDQVISNLNNLVRKYLGSAEHNNLAARYPNVNFEIGLDPDLLNIACSLIHIQKILMNLIGNAAEAVGGEGEVTVSTSNIYLDEPLKGYENIVKGEYVMLAVSDNGSGISHEDISRIFEPFYSKKIIGRSGTGLGLAIVWNAVQDNNGYINVTSDEQRTLFELYFPVTRKETTSENTSLSLKDYTGNGEKILVVDDEQRQREIACSLLKKLGYNADAVSSGEDAVKYLKANSMDLVVLDMIMPRGINGLETYKKIIKINPGQKAVIASGFAANKDVKAAQKAGAGTYIKKPYSVAKIGCAIKEELSGKK